MIDPKTLEEWKRLAREAAHGCNCDHTAAHEELAEAVPALIAEVERLQRFDARVSGDVMEIQQALVKAGGIATNGWVGMVHNLIRDRERLRGLLREVEWAPTMTGDALGEGHDRCPKCLAERRDGHAPDCALAAELKP